MKANTRKFFRNSKKRKCWTYKFDAHGGYDALSAGYLIFNPEGKFTLVIDTRNFRDAETYEEAHTECDDAKELTEDICLFFSVARPG